jgi:dihydrofolate reductase
VPKLLVRSFTISLDGYGAGPHQSLDNPLGEKGTKLHEWAFATRTFRKMFGQEGGESGTDDEFAAMGFENIGAWILGRNMFGPVRGPWPDESWKGWWGDNPPYHVPVFVLTHHARAPLAKDVRLGGGVATIQEYLRARLVDEMHLAVAPVFLGRGENLYAEIDLSALGYALTERIATPGATHLRIAKDTGGA